MADRNSEPAKASPARTSVFDQIDHWRLQELRGRMTTHQWLRRAGLLTILALLVVVYPLLTAIDRLSVPRWRAATLPGSEQAALPTSRITAIVVDLGQGRIHLTSGAGTVTLPVTTAAPVVRGETRGLLWKPGTISLGPGYPCFERATAGFLRHLGTPSLTSAASATCVRLDAAAYDAIFTHADDKTPVQFR